MQKTSIVAFRRGYRLQWEAAQESHVILYPEGMAKLNETAAAILELVDGRRDVAAIIAMRCVSETETRPAGRHRHNRRR